MRLQIHSPATLRKLPANNYWVTLLLLLLLLLSGT